LQFRLAAAAKNDKAAGSVIACMDEELPATVEDMPLRLARHFFLGQVLLCTEVNLSIAQLVAMGIEYTRLGDELGDVLARVHEPGVHRAMTGPDGTPDLAGIAGFMLTAHLPDRHSLAALQDACEPVETSAVRRLLWFVGGLESTAQLVFDRAWLAEFKNASPDWVACRDAFQRAYALGRRCELPGLAQGAARAIARITDENLNDPAEALRLADAMAAEIGWSPGQEDGRASILQRKGDAAAALSIWRELLPRWMPKDEFDLQQTFSHRQAAVAAARLNQWTEAADWLRSARELADDVNQATYCAGLFVDQGYARWKGGDDRAALQCLVEGLAAIDQLPSDHADENAYLLRKRAGHTIMWIANTAAGTPPRDFPAPPPACCSSLDPVKEARVPSTPSDAMWTHVLEFEFVAELGDEQFRAHEAQLKASRYGLIRFTFDRLRLRRRLRSMMLDDFVEIVGDWAESFALWRLYYKENGLRPADPLPAEVTAADRQQLDAELVLSGMLNGIFVLAERDAVAVEVLEHWTASAARAGLSAIVTPWLEFVAALFVSNTLNGETTVRDQSLAWPWQAVASVRVAIDGATRPAELLTIHAYWANVLPKATTGLFVLAEIEHLVTSAWQRLSEQSFLLRAPALTVPALQRACSSTSTGWRKIGEVLTAACDAVPATVPGEFRERFRGL
jgi:hypothetical protein